MGYPYIVVQTHFNGWCMFLVYLLPLLFFSPQVRSTDSLPVFETVSVDPGEFMMGCLPKDTLCVPFEKPRHKVKITHRLEVMTTEVTQELYQVVVGKNPSRFTDCGPRCPVENVNWDEAISFANKLSLKQGLTPCYKLSGSDIEWDIGTCTGWRLPTEAEWEWLAKGGKNDLYSGGLSPGDRAWYKANSQDQSHPVGQKKPNAYGLYDMSGNVFEWVWDWYGAYSDTPSTNPIGPEGGMDKVCRGGGWNLETKFARVSRRMHDMPAVRSGFIGFRLVRKL